VTASPLSFPNLGDESIAVRFHVKSSSVKLGLDLVGIRFDHNMVLVDTRGLAALPT
jgi:hypothetical protein